MTRAIIRTNVTAPTLAFAAYLLLGIASLWGLVTDISGHVPDGSTTDYYQFIWNYWWIGHALEHGWSPWYTDFVLYPNTHNLSLHTLTPIWFPLHAVVEPLAGRVTAVNLMLLLTFPLNGLLMYLWLRPWLRRDHLGTLLAFLGGLVFAFQPYLLYATSKSHLNVTGMWWLPLTLLLWREIVNKPRLPRFVTAGLLGLTFWGCWLTDFQYALFLPPTLGLYGLWTLWATRQDGEWRRLLGWGLLALGIMALLMLIWPLIPLLQVDTGNPNLFPPAGLDTARALSLPVEALAGLAERDAGRTMGLLLPWLTWLTLLVALLTRRRPSCSLVDAARPPHWLWLLSALPLALLMLGPDVRIAGTRIDLPYRALHDLMNGQYRNPQRFVMPLAFALVTFITLTWSPLVGWLAARRWLTVPGAALLAIALLLDAGALAPFPTRAVKDYAIHEQIAAEDEDYVILDVPVGTHYGWTGLGDGGQYTQFYGPVHEKRMVNGGLSRIPYPDFAYYADSPLFRWLAQGYKTDSGQMETINARFQTIRSDWPLGYVFAHRQYMTPGQANVWIGWLNVQPGLCPPSMTPDDRLIWWRNADLGCAPSSTEALNIDVGTPSDWRYIGPGWYQQEQIGGETGRWSSREATIRADLNSDTAYALTFTALAFEEARTLTIGGQSVTISADGWQTYTLTIPACSHADGLLTLSHDGVLSPAEVTSSGDMRTLAVAYADFSFSKSE